MSQTRNDDELIIIEENNIEDININPETIEEKNKLIEVDINKEQELISFDEKINNNFNLDFDEKNEEKSDQKNKKDIELEDNIEFDFGIDIEKKEESELNSKLEKIENILEKKEEKNTNIDGVDITSSISFENLGKEEKENNIKEFNETQNKESLNLEVEEKSSRKELEKYTLIEENKEDKIFVKDNTIEEEESMNSILEGTIEKLNLRKEKSQNNIKEKNKAILEIDEKISKLKKEKENIILEVNKLEDENKKISDNISGLEEMKNSESNKLIQSHNYKRKKQ